MRVMVLQLPRIRMRWWRRSLTGKQVSFGIFQEIFIGLYNLPILQWAPFEGTELKKVIVTISPQAMEVSSELSV